MKKTSLKLLCALLLAAMLLTMTGCAQKDEAPAAAQMQILPGGEIGKGEKAFAFTVVDKDGRETAFTVHTDKETVGDALLEVNLIAGEQGDYGLYVKQVNGVTADYDVDKTYWAFYVNGEYAMSGVDVTKIEENTTYILKVEK